MKTRTETIKHNDKFSLHFNGDFYQVSEGPFEYLLTNKHLSFDEANELFNAVTFCDVEDLKPSFVSSIIAKSRLEKTTDLFWFFVDSIENL